MHALMKAQILYLLSVRSTVLLHSIVYLMILIHRLYFVTALYSLTELQVLSGLFSLFLQKCHFQ